MINRIKKYIKPQKKHQSDICFGVVTPTYNRPDLLKRCMESVVAQTYPYWQMVVVDDSTNDDTQQFMQREYMQQGGNEQMIYLKNSQNKGVGYTRNKALDYLQDKVDYIVLLDDDDFFDSDTLKNAAQAISKNKNCAWFVSRRLYADTKKSITQIKKRKKMYCYIQDCLLKKYIRKDTTQFISTQALKKSAARFDENIKTGGEWRFFAQLALQYQFCFFEGGVSYGNYLADGLSAGNCGNVSYHIKEQMDLLTFLQAHELSPLKQTKVLLKLIKLYATHEPQKIAALMNKHTAQLPFLNRQVIKLRANISQ